MGFAMILKQWSGACDDFEIHQRPKIDNVNDIMLIPITISFASLHSYTCREDWATASQPPVWLGAKIDTKIPEDNSRSVVPLTHSASITILHNESSDFDGYCSPPTFMFR